jgi:hypothetical protein
MNSEEFTLINQLIVKLEEQRRLERKKEKEEERHSRLGQERMVSECKPIDTLLRRAHKTIGNGFHFGIYEYDYNHTLFYEGFDEKRQRKESYLIYEWRDSSIWGFLHKQLCMYAAWDEHKDKILPALEKSLQDLVKTKMDVKQ